MSTSKAHRSPLIETAQILSLRSEFNLADPAVRAEILTCDGLVFSSKMQFSLAREAFQLAIKAFDECLASESVPVLESRRVRVEQWLLALPEAFVPTPQVKLKNRVVLKAAGNMTRARLVEIAAQSASITKTKARVLLNVILDQVQQTVANGESVHLAGFGTFKSTVRAARVGKNPQTGKTLRIVATTKPKFVPGTAFKDSVASEKIAGARSRKQHRKLESGQKSLNAKGVGKGAKT